jgi:hypothetical protein
MERTATLQPRKLLLIDGSGATLSAGSLLLVALFLHEALGIPQGIFFGLAFLASLYAVFSFSSALLLTQGFERRLRYIAYANLTHCCLTAALMIVFRESLTVLGLFYFAVEFAVIGVLVYFEFKLSS